ncbi:MAG: ubiquinol-cytochrome C chaperone family protein [Rhizobiales bacterium]|nr:ubiquinol-cytochrome C chaperone family protein [Hyphomicrobiales bacterium]
MIFPRFGRAPRDADTISAVYGMIVAQARLPCFYRDYAVADTVNGRFDLIVLHLALVIERVTPETDLRVMGQGLFDRFCRDMDHNLREMGVGDLKVPVEMRRMGEAFYGRAQAYRVALGTADTGEALVAAVTRNIYGGSPESPAVAGRLAAYIRATDRDLKGQRPAELRAGKVRFPDPAVIPAVTG